MSGFCECYWDDESVINRCEHRRARKSYKCDECSGPIAAGERYRHQAWLYPGNGWNAYRCCAACVEGPIEFIERNCGCVMYGGIEEHLTTVFHEYAFQHPGVKFRLGRMLVEMRRRRERSYQPSAARGR